jgi:hypothetical protein
MVHLLALEVARPVFPLPGNCRTPSLLLAHLLERQVSRFSNDTEHRVRRSAWQSQAMQSFPSLDSCCGTIELTRLLDPFSLSALRLLSLLANNPRGVDDCRIGVISR